MNPELKDWLNSINFKKNNIIDENPENENCYPSYIVNRCLSGFIDTIMYANEMNIHNFLDKKLQYDFYINTVRPKKRFTPWLKKEKLEDLELVKQYYGYNNEKARTALRILTEQQLEFIRTKLDKGGKK
jgi:Bacteriophage clamp loader A subunit